MKLFECDSCGQPLYFENTRCERCGRALGYAPELTSLLSLEPEGEAWHGAAGSGLTFRSCGNAQYAACNWLIPADSAETFCQACRHNRTIPDLSIDANRALFRRLEHAKHRLFYSLLRWRLRLPNRIDDPENGLAFDLLAERDGGPPVMTGHADGIITVSAAEAEGAERERRRNEMGETYRTLLGHFRHEAGHYFWDTLVRRKARLAAFRALFGDERSDYGAALERYYQAGPAEDWQQRFITPYGSAHPWEDFAESWAHLLHIVDTLETAAAFGTAVRPSVQAAPEGEVEADFDPYDKATIGALIERWIPLTFAVNSLNRSMGQPDLYPFVLSPKAIEKLGFVLTLVREAGRRP